MKCCLLLLSILLAPALTFATTLEHNQTMAFQNQRGSTLHLTLHQQSKNSGTVTGTFETAVSSKTCQNVVGKPQKITGFYTGNAITLSITYPQCGAAIAIVGNFDQNNNIETLWIDAQQGQHPEGKDWNTRMIGYDNYRRVS